MHAPTPDEEWVDACAQTYVGLRTSVAVPLTEISLDGIDLVDVATLRDRIRQAAIPVRRGGPLDVLRSDLGEVLAYELLEGEYQARFGYKSVRDRELPQLPGRGIDAIGVEQDSASSDGAPRFRLVLAEVKVSDENRCPPRVVDGNTDSLRLQHLRHMAQRDVTVSKVFQHAQRTVDAHTRDQLMAAGLLFEHNSLDRVTVVACSVLVRSSERCADADCGSFLSSPADFAPATVRFLIVQLPDAVDTVVSKWVERVGAIEEAA